MDIEKMVREKQKHLYPESFLQEPKIDRIHRRIEEAKELFNRAFSKAIDALVEAKEELNKLEGK